MEKLQKPQDIYVRQRRWVTAFFAFLSLVLLLGVIVLPIAYAVSPPEDYSQAFFICTIVAAAFFGIPLAFLFIASVVKLRLTFVIIADEKGIYINSTLVSYGFIPWDNIAEIHYYGILDGSSEILAPDTNHLKITLRSKERFIKGLNFIQRVYFRLNFSRLYCNTALCKGKGAAIGAALRQAWLYYAGEESAGE